MPADPQEARVKMARIARNPRRATVLTLALAAGACAAVGSSWAALKPPAPTTTTTVLDPFTLQTSTAPATSTPTYQSDNIQVTSAAAPVHRPPTRPAFRPPPRSPFVPGVSPGGVGNGY